MITSETDRDIVTKLLSENIRSYRLLRRLDQRQIAEAMIACGYGWHRNTVSEVERARRNVTVPELLALSWVLNAPIARLLSEGGPEA